MAPMTKQDQQKDAMADAETPGSDEPVDRVEPVDPEATDEQDEALDRDERRDKALAYQTRLTTVKEKPAAGFFTIYKSGQGYWTRMGTAATAAVLAIFACFFLAEHLPTWVPLGADKQPRTWLIAGIIAAFVAVYGALVWWLTNKPTNVDFLIATDSEMKKVNWTSRKELIGSTKVVIVFMFLIATFLFVVDIVFGYFFYFLNVMKTKPF